MMVMMIIIIVIHVQSDPFNITLEGLSVLCEIKRSWY